MAVRKAPPGYAYVKQPNGKYRLVKQGGGARPATGAAKPATTPARKPAKTFTDPQGVVRFVGSGLARNPLEQQVDAAMLSETAPIKTNIGLAGSQYDAEKAELERAMGATNSELERIGGNIGAIGQLDLGMQSQQGALANHQANLDYLQSVLGGKVQDIGALLAAGAEGAANIAGDRASGMTQAQLGTLAAVNETGPREKAGTMRTREDIANRLLARDAALKGYNDQLGAIKAGRADIRRQISKENLDASIARAELKLAQQQAAHGMAMDEAQLALDSQAAAGGDGKPVDKGIYGFGANKDEGIRTVLQAWQSAMAGNKVKQPWRELYAQLSSVGGLNADQAALLATKTSPASIRNAEHGAAGVLSMLQQRHVSPKVQAFIIKTYFGDETWANLTSHQRPAGATSGTYMPTTGSTHDQRPGHTTSAAVTQTVNTLAPSLKPGSSFKVGRVPFKVVSVGQGLGFKIVRVQRADGSGGVMSVRVRTSAGGAADGMGTFAP